MITTDKSQQGHSKQSHQNLLQKSIIGSVCSVLSREWNGVVLRNSAFYHVMWIIKDSEKEMRPNALCILYVDVCYDPKNDAQGTHFQNASKQSQMMRLLRLNMYHNTP